MRVGIDLGGTKIEGVVLDQDGAIVARLRVATPRDDYEATVSAICELVHRLDDRGVARVGVGTPGAWQGAVRQMKNCNSTWLNGRGLLDDLNARLSDRVRIANDADCFTLSEATDGAGMGVATVFGVILGTGVGGGFVVDGKLLSGPNATAGEWGHTPLPYFRAKQGLDDRLDELEARLDGRTCYCGRRNCVETFLSGPGFAASHRELWGEASDPRQIAEAVSEPAEWSRQLYRHMLARCLAQIVNVVDPGIIVLGGGLSQCKFLYEGLNELMSATVFSSECVTRVRPARHGDSSGVRGAAWL